MPYRFLISALVVLALLAAGLGQAWRSYRAFLDRRAVEHESQLTHDDPAVRLEASTALLRMKPDRHELRLVRAQALIDRARHVEAWQTLDDMGSLPPALLREAMALRAECQLAEAQRIIESADPRTHADRLREAESWINQTENLSRLIPTRTGDRDLADAVLARAMDLRAELLRVEALILEADLAQGDDSPAVGESVTLHDVRVAAFRRQAEELDTRLIRLCESLMARAPGDYRPYETLVHLWHRRGDRPGARRAAQRLAQLPRVGRATAGEVALTLLSLESTRNLETGPQEIDIARRLLDHPGLQGSDPLRKIETARVHLALREGRFQEADSLLKQVADAAGGHSRLAALQAHAFVGLGRAQDAANLLGRYADRMPTPFILNAQAEALWVLGQRDRAVGALRDSADLNPTMLATRLRLAQLLTELANPIEAEPDIRAAAELSPDHSAVRALQVQLLLARGQVDPLADWMERYLAGRSPSPPDVVALVLWAAMDEPPEVERLALRLLDQDPADGLAPMARMWTTLEPAARSHVASLLVQAAIEHVDSDPLARLPLASPLPAGLLAPTIEPLGYPRHERLALELADAAWVATPDREIARAGAALTLLLDAAPSERELWLARWKPVGASDAAERSAIMRSIQAMNEQAQPAAPPQDPVTNDMGALPEKSSFRTWLGLQEALAGGDAEEFLRRAAAALRAKPWSEAIILRVLSWADRKSDPELAERWLRLAQVAAPQAAGMSRARWAIAHARADEALSLLEPMLREYPHAAEISVRAAALRSLVMVRRQEVDAALSALETLAVDARLRRPHLRHAVARALASAGRQRAAASTLTTALLPDSPARAVAASLLPCEDWLDARRLDAEIDPRLAARPNDPVLLWLKARAFARRGDARAGLPLLSRAIQARPTSPVLALERVRLLAAVGDEPGRAAALESLRSLTDRAAWPDLIPPQPVVGGGLGNALTDHSP